MEYRIVPGIGLVLDTGKKGKKVWFLALTHGNEPAGLQAQERFLSQYAHCLQAGQVYLLQVNPLAYALGKRFVDVNMNRIWKLEQDLTRYEDQRLQELLPYLEELDVVLDIHSVPTSTTQTMGICATRDQEIAEHVLGVDILLVDDDFDQAGSLISYVTRRGGIWFGMECGSHLDPQGADRALQVMLRILSDLEMLSMEIEPAPRIGSVFKFFQEIYPQSPEFRYLKAYANFSRIWPSESYAQDGEIIYGNQTQTDKYLGIIMDKVILGDGMGFLFDKLR